ncbi:MAG: SUF system NifU family Fe-S cluster assembly protein [Microbacteriaceae bacterium]|nr:SUF system NifU family Fe-S cluster assembly protein [Microbacteriaceae bacterium]
MAHDDFRNLYQDLLIDHSRERHGYGLCPNPSAESHQRNRSCGDEITVRVNAENGVIESVSWEGQGCSISQASASMLSDLAAHTSTVDITGIVAAFRSMLHSRGKDEGSEDLLGDAIAFSGVSKYPPRINCAMLAWVALEDALSQLVEAAPPETTENTQ